MHPLASKIHSLQRRLAVRQSLVAACRIAAAILAAALLLGLMDCWFRYNDRGLRLMATLVFLGASAWAIYRWWFLPSRRRLNSLAVAQRVENHFPELRDSLTSAVEFLDQSETDPMAGSAMLRRTVVSETETAVADLPLDDVIDRRPLRRAASWLALAAIILLALTAWDARAVGTAAARLVAPFSGTEWPRQNHLAFRNPPTRLAVGQPFEVELVDTSGNLPDEVRIEYRFVDDDGRQTTSEPMTRVGDAMVARRESVRQSFSFRAAGGDDDTMRWQHVEVVEPPRLESLSLVVHPPTYTGQSPAPAERHLNVLAGSSIEATGMADKTLRAARVLLPDEKSVSADLQPQAHGDERLRFVIAANRWIAEENGKYRLELEDTKGIAGIVAEGNLRVEPDAPPTIAWRQPADDLYVTTTAVVPIELVVKDNLAIERVELIYQRTDGVTASDMSPIEGVSNEEHADASVETRLTLHRGPATPPVVSREANGHDKGETRVVAHAWNLDPLRLPAGAQLALRAEAADYRPGIGRTIGTRGISIITPAALEARLASRQQQIAHQLERALAIEESAREEVRRLEIQQRDAGALTDGDRNALQAVELSQRRVGRMVSDHVEGVPALVDSLLTELDMNRVNSTEMRRTMSQLMASINQLANGPLSAAEQELTAARKAVESTGQDELLSRSLSGAGAAQDQIAAELERLRSQLSGSVDYRRFARELAELREDQLAHEKASRAEIDLDTLPLETDELSRAQRAELNKAVAGEEAIERRFVKIQQGMAALADELTSKDGAVAGNLRDAAALATELNIATKIQEAVVNLRENRVGRALQLETEIAADLQQVLDILLNRSERDAARLVDKLRAAEQRLADLRHELAELSDELEHAEQQAPASPNRRSSQQRTEQLRKEIGKLARELKRLDASDASQSTQQAGGRLGEQADQDRRNAEANQPSSRHAQQAEQDLAKAADQLAAQRQQAEDDLALEFVRRFQAELGQMVERQRNVVNETIAVDETRQDADRLTAAESRRLKRLVDEERSLAVTAREQSELLFGLGSLRLSLEDTVDRLSRAADLLETQETGATTQQVEQTALKRLEGMLEAFAQTAAEAGQNNQGGGGAGGTEGPQRRPTFELLEVKVLRLLQVDLNERTTRYQQTVANMGDLPADSPEKVELSRQAAELAAEQARLADLVEEMLSRDNEEGR